MAAPTNVTVPGARTGFNGFLRHSAQGTRNIRVDSIQKTTAINTQEDAASQAKTIYPLWVSQGAFTLRLLFLDPGERDALSDWVANFMRAASSARLEDATMEVSVPGRRFHRRAIPRGTLVYGSEQGSNPMKTTTLSFVGAEDPVRRWRDRSRMRSAPNDPTASYFYPAGIQVGWSLEEQIYDEGRNPAPGPWNPPRPV